MLEFLLILGLAGWAWWQTQRLGALKRQLNELERKLAALTATPARPQDAAASTTASEEPLLLTEVVPPDAIGEPLLLDTPIPEASNDHEPLTPAARDEVAAVMAEPMRPVPEAAKPPPRTAPPRERRLEQWLAEKGLAWLGGGALALGGILLVAFATQQSWFAPPVQLGCAVTLGLVLIGLSQWLLRKHALVAALLAGAGVATLYATAWGAHALYGMIGWGAALSALVLCALLLIGLSFRHGQALGVLAILAALLAPALASMGDWPAAAVTLFLLAVAAAGFTLAALRRWAWVAVATLLGVYFWFAVAIAADEARRALALLSFASLGGVALAFRKPLTTNEQGRAPWTHAYALGPSIALSISSVAMIWAWLAALPAVAGPAWVGALFVALAAAAVRARVAPPAVLIVAIVTLVAGFVAHLTALRAPPSSDFYPFILFASAATAVSALAAKPHRTARSSTAASGALGAALLTALAATTRADWHAPAAWTPLMLGAAILFAAAWITARDAADARADRATDFWAGAAVALLLTGIESLFADSIRAAAHASIALSLTAAFMWRGWRALRVGALAAAGLALAHALSPALINATLAGALTLTHCLFVLGLGAGFLLCAAYIVQQRGANRNTGEALSTAAAMFALIGVFVALRWAIWGPNPPFDHFTETSLRVATLMAMGHLTLVREGENKGRIAALRGHVLMASGAIYAALAPGLIVNPWWGAAPASVSGPPLLGPIMLAFAIPGALLLYAARRLYQRQRQWARAYAAAGAIFALLWAVLEIRVAFHGADAAKAAVGVFEAALYALALLAAALAIAVGARLRKSRGPLEQDLFAIARGVAWVALVGAGFILLIARHPWWGGQSAASDNLETALAVLAQAGAVVLALALGRALSVSTQVTKTRFAAASAAILFGWSFGHAAIRWLYHKGGMDDGAALILLEGYTHALWPLAFALLGAAVTARAPGRDTVRAYLHDLQAIWSAAVWPALIFAALGLWLFYAPWWGLYPARADRAALSAIVITLLALAAALSVLATHAPRLRFAAWFKRAAHVAAAGHIFVALNFLVRACFHGGAIVGGATGGAETWIYSALWALYGAALLAYGTWRDNAALRWCGLALLLAATVKVFLFDTARLSGFVRAGSALGLGIVLTVTALLVRRPPPARRS